MLKFVIMLNGLLWVYMQIFDKLCQSFGGDVLQVLLNSAVAIGECPQDRLIKQWLQFCLDQSIAIVSFHILTYIVSNWVKGWQLVASMMIDWNVQI